MAAAPFGGGGFATGSSFMGTGVRSLALDVSGVSFALSAMSLADVSFPLVTLSITWALTLSALPEVANLSASSRLFGACAAIAVLTAAMNAALSKSPGLAAAILSACAA